MIASLAKRGLRYLWDAKGITLSRKIVVIESDDWGSIRMPSKAVYDFLSSKYPQSCTSVYQRVDTLESRQDLNLLFEVLQSVKGSDGGSAKLTANVIMANPDFEKIRDSEYEIFHYEDFRKTLQRTHSDDVFGLFKSGIDEHLVTPQFHGRDHVNTSAWLRELRAGNKILVEAFNLGVYALDYDFINTRKPNLMAALDYSSDTDLQSKVTALTEGLESFKQAFGAPSYTFIAPSYTWNEQVERAVQPSGVNAFQGIRIQKQPTGKEKKYRQKLRYMGEKNAFGQTYMIRNVFFEPSILPDNNLVNKCLNRIDQVFRMKKPAIIGSHRLNFMGGLDLKNRDQNLRSFRVLLSEIVRRWPNVEFMSSEELAKLIRGQHSSQKFGE